MPCHSPPWDPFPWEWQFLQLCGAYICGHTQRHWILTLEMISPLWYLTLLLKLKVFLSSKRLPQTQSKGQFIFMIFFLVFLNGFSFLHCNYRQSQYLHAFCEVKIKIVYYFSKWWFSSTHLKKIIVFRWFIILSFSYAIYVFIFQYYLYCLDFASSFILWMFAMFQALWRHQDK